MFMALKHTRKVATPEEVLAHIAITPLRELAPPHWYRSVVPGLPDILALRVSRSMHDARSGNSFSLKWTLKVVVSETEGDARFLEHMLDRPLPFDGNVVSFNRSVDKTNQRPSVLPSSNNFLLLHYGPSEEGWPHLAVFMLPCRSPDPMLLRGRYGWGAYATMEEVFARHHRVAHGAGLVPVD